MADLDAIIRVQLAGWRLNVESLREHGMDLIALDALMQAQSAIGAVLDLHKPRTAVEGPLEGKPICDGCSDGTNEWLATADPCRTIRDIATELGIQVNDG